VLSAGVIHTSGDTLPDPSLPVSGVDSDINTLLFKYLRNIDLWGRSANLILDVPYSDGETSALSNVGGELHREYDGLGDISATLSVNFLGAPALDRESFADLRRNPRSLLGGSVKVVAPTGEYDSARGVNVGANRWATKAELGYIAPFFDRWLFELQLGTWVFGDNDDFLGMKKEQDPLTALEVHIVRRIAPAFWVSLDANYYKGGRSSLDGERQEDLQRDSKLGLTVMYPIAKGHSLKLSYSLGSVTDSGEDFNSIAVFYQRVF
jgi:Putative MetA-pathway of phenol degradation